MEKEKNKNPNSTDEEKKRQARERFDRDMDAKMEKDTGTFIKKESRFARLDNMDNKVVKQSMDFLDEERSGIREQLAEEIFYSDEKFENINIEALRKEGGGKKSRMEIILEFVGNDPDSSKKLSEKYKKNERAKRLELIAKDLGSETSFQGRVLLLNELVPTDKKEFEKIWQDKDKQELIEEVWGKTTGRELENSAKNLYFKKKIEGFIGTAMIDASKKAEGYTEEEWKRLDKDKKTEILKGERFEEVKNKMKEAGWNVSDKQMVAIGEMYPQIFNKDIEFTNIIKSKSLRFEGTINYKLPKDKIPNEIRITKGKLSNKIKKNEEEVKNRMDELKRDAILETLGEDEEKRGTAVEIITEGLKNKLIDKELEKLEAQGVFERERNPEMEGGKKIVELLENLFEDPSAKEKIAELLEALKKSGFLEALGFSKSESKDEEGESEEQKSAEQIKEKLKETLGKKEMKGLFTCLAVVLMIMFLVLEKIFKSGSKKSG